MSNLNTNLLAHLQLKQSIYFTPSWNHESAWLGHVHFAAWLMQAMRPKTFVELGTHTGVSYFSFCQAAKEGGVNTRCFAVDNWRGDQHSRFYGEDVFQMVSDHNAANYGQFSTLLRMDFDQAVERFEDRSVNLLHIDGFHTYAAVKRDFETWSPKLAEDAIVLFHDTQVFDNDFGAWKIWEELSERFARNLEFVHGHGLGVLAVGELTSSHADEWLEQGSMAHSMVQIHFEGLGRKQIELNERKAEIEYLRGQVELQYGQVQLQERRLQSLTSSLSWKITGPLRWMLDSLKNKRLLSNTVSQTAALAEFLYKRFHPISVFKTSPSSSNKNANSPTFNTFLGEITKRIDISPEDQFLIFVGHEASFTGGPLILLRVLKQLRNRSGHHSFVILARGGPLLDEFRAIGPVLVLEDVNADASEWATMAHESVSLLRRRKPRYSCIFNTAAVPKSVVSCFAKEDNCISLVHELPNAINALFGGLAQMQHLQSISRKIFFPSALARSANTEAFKLEPSICEVLPYGVVTANAPIDKTALSTRLRNELNVGKHTKIISAVGTYEHRKGLDIFVDAAIALAKDCESIGQEAPLFVWAGPGKSSEFAVSQRSRIAPEFRRLFIFKDTYREPDIFTGGADVFVLPSREESAGLVALEAASYGTPVCLFAGCTGAEEYLPPESVRLVYSNKPEELAKSIKEILARFEGAQTDVTRPLHNDQHTMMSTFTWSKYADALITHVQPKKTFVELNERNPRSVLLVGYGPPPVGGMISEGSGLRNWGLATALASKLPHHVIKLAYKVAGGKNQVEASFDNVLVMPWDHTLSKHLSTASTVLLSYCMGEDTGAILRQLRPWQQCVLDCYVPIYTEVCARDFSDKQSETSAYLNDIKHWNENLRRGDLFLCANLAQKDYYNAILSALGRVNPSTYDENPLRIVPYGIPSSAPAPTDTPITSYLKKRNKEGSFKLLWFGGLYPWFDVETLLRAVKALYPRYPINLSLVGAKNPFVTHPAFSEHHDSAGALIDQLRGDGAIHVEEWVPYSERHNWYADADLIVSINKTGHETKLSWRTRLVDYVSGPTPIATNGGDPLGEELIACGAALRLDAGSVSALADSIVSIADNKERLRQCSKNLAEYRPRLFWSNVVDDLVKDIDNHYA